MERVGCVFLFILFEHKYQDLLLQIKCMAVCMGREVNREEFLGNFYCEKSTGMNDKKLSKVLVQYFLYTLTLHQFHTQCHAKKTRTYKLSLTEVNNHSLVHHFQMSLTLHELI